MVSSVTEGDIKKLRGAGYLAADIARRLPAAAQVIPTLEPHERVVFLHHFLHGLGFPLHPFVLGLMFYYGLDFHDMAPNFILNISAFIVMCEAFLRIRRWWAANKRNAAEPWWARCPMLYGSKAPSWRP